MCRLLSVKSSENFEILPHLDAFAELSRTSKEFQGHGWGLSLRKNGAWEHYRDLKPIWEDNLSSFGATTELLVHARSAFRDEGITIENNMPFYDQHYVFIFNGELQGVRIKETGRIGAEKIFNYIKRFDQNDMHTALAKGTDLISKRTRYVRAMNIIVSDAEQIYLSTQYSEDPEYFGMWKKIGRNSQIICSDPYPEQSGWENIPNNSSEVF